MTAPDLPTLRSILARLEAATGPDRELDAEIAIALLDAPKLASGKKVRRTDLRASKEGYVHHKADLCYSANHYTASIDAAVALIERVLPGAEWSAARNSNGEYFGWIVSDGMPHCDDHETPALVLCTALVKALIAVAKQ